MVDFYRYRIQSSDGWGAVVARVENALPETLTQCLGIVRRHALENKIHAQSAKNYQGAVPFP